MRELATIIRGDQVEVEGTPIYNEEKVYYLLNKPRGVISSVSDDKDGQQSLTFYLKYQAHLPSRTFETGFTYWYLDFWPMMAILQMR